MTSVHHPATRGGAGNCSASRAFACGAGLLRAALVWAALSIGTVTASLAQSLPVGSEIRNVATVGFTLGTAAREVATNEVRLRVEPAPSRAQVAFARFAGSPFAPADSSVATFSAKSGPSVCLAPGGEVPLASARVAGAGSVDPEAAVPFALTDSQHAGDATFLRLVDADQNRDPTAFETVELRVTSRATGDVERVRVSETTRDSGVFVGFLPTRLAPANPGDCVLEVARDGEIDVRYVDTRDSTDTATAVALVDPSGRVFDSATGLPVDGVRVRLVDATTGAPAEVFGDDGVSRFPSELITGEPATDSGGTTYRFGAGVYRFPLVRPGQYRLVIEAPAGYLFASGVTVPELQRLPGAPFRLGPASFGAAFTVVAPVGSVIDVPLDRTGDQLVVRKESNAQVASVGDFVAFDVVVQNASRGGEIRNLELRDRLPAGLRLLAGSFRLDGRPLADPALDATGREFAIALGTLPAGAQRRLRYVVEVTVAATRELRTRELVNLAWANAAGAVRSNEARAKLRLRDELFADRSFIAGRVTQGACDAAPGDAQGVPNVRVFLEDGRYALTDADGRYHFDGVEPGTHVVQLDADSLPEALEREACGAGRARNAGRGNAQFVELRRGALWAVDFRLPVRPPASGSVSLTLRSQIVDARRAQHDFSITNEGVGLTAARLLVMLPTGLVPARDGASVDGRPLGTAPTFADGVVSLPVGDLGAGERRSVRLVSEADGSGAGGELAVKALLDYRQGSGESGRTPVIENRVWARSAEARAREYRFTPRFDSLDTRLRPEDERALEAMLADWRRATVTRLRVVGHADSLPITARQRARFADNVALSTARARVVADYLAARLGLAGDAVVVEGRGDAEPVAAGRDAASLALNRRVEIEIEGRERVADARLELRVAEAAPVRAATLGAQAAPRAPSAPVGPRRAPRHDTASTRETPVDLDALDGSPAWIAPEEGANPEIASLKIAIAHGADQSVELSIGGAPVDRLNFDGSKVNGARTAAVSRWRGVDLVDGPNRLVAIVRNADGSEAARLTRVVHYGAGPVRAEIDRERSTLIADGRTRPAVVLRLFDAHGRPARAGTRGAFRVDPPYRSWYEVEQLDDNPLLAEANREPFYEVEDDGTARLELEPTTQTGYVTLNLRYNERRTEQLRVWLQPGTRDWIFVGLAEGSAAWNAVSRRMEPLPGEVAAEEGFADSGRVAFFAKGQVRGDWLLTLAYDSARDTRAARERLQGVIEPDRYYLLYGDGADPRHEAASAKKLYLKLERRQFAALFGDFESGLTVTELTRYRRSLTGLKADYAGQQVSATGFAARSDLGFARDQFQGDGTSGLYRLSRAPIVINSDRIRIEVRDRFRTERVLESRELARFLDYRLDYETGELRFSEPVPSRDPAFNPVFVVAEYETAGNGQEVTSAGGRVAFATPDGRVEAGISAIRDGAIAGDTDLAGADLRWKLSDVTRLEAEVAASRSDDPARVEEARAWLIELEHLSERLEARVYARELEDGFGVEQQSATETGTRRFGGEARWNFTPRLGLQGEWYRQQVLATGAERQLASGELRLQREVDSLAIGLRSVTDELPADQERRSDHAFVTGSVDLFERRITLRAAAETALGARDASADFPTRTRLGVDWHATRETTLFAEWERAEGADLDSDMTRLGVRARPWERTQVQSSVATVVSEYGPRSFANFGLTQGFRLSERWTLDLGLDQSDTLRGAALAPLDADVPLASGSLTEDYTAAFLGAQYRREDWSFTSRLENRRADSEDRWNLLAGWYREPSSGHALSLALTAQDSAGRRAPLDAQTVDLRFAWAWRPGDGSWIVFNRIDLVRDTRSDLDGEFESTRWTNNAHVNWQWGAATQLGLQLGLRQVASTFDGDRYRGLTSLLGVDLRRDLGWRPFGRALDVGLHGAQRWSHEARVSDLAIGLDVGVTLLPNTWISLGWNFRGFEDRDFGATRETQQGPYLRFRIKADQDSFRDLRLDSLRPAR